MQHDFWHDKWQTIILVFIRPTHALLTQYFRSLDFKASCSYFVPFCGKSLDISWLINQGYQIVGIDLSPIA